MCICTCTCSRFYQSQNWFYDFLNYNLNSFCLLLIQIMQSELYWRLNIIFFFYECICLSFILRLYFAFHKSLPRHMNVTSNLISKLIFVVFQKASYMPYLFLHSWNISKVLWIWQFLRYRFNIFLFLEIHYCIYFNIQASRRTLPFNLTSKQEILKAEGFSGDKHSFILHFWIGSFHC